MSDGDSYEMDESDERNDDPYPLPRDHSYLVAAHPLVVNKRHSERHKSSHNSLDPFFELAVLELFGVVLFPGSTIPVKLRDRSLIEYLGRQIEVCREAPHLLSEVRLGILTYNHNHSEVDRYYVGRIGTIATIKYTHEHSDLNNSTDSLNTSHMWRRYQEGNELIFTAVGTRRFIIVEPSSNSRIFKVEEMKDRPLSLPPIKHCFASFPRHDRPQENDSTPDKDSRHKHRAWCLSMITPVPYFVYEKMSPWKLVSELMEALEQNSGRNHLPSLGELHKESMMEPTTFSFWCASNMPFSESDRLILLESNSTFERLRIISEKVKELSRQERYICCSGCETKLSTVDRVFTVDGAEGATSAYVNGHGYIHQITTLRDVAIQEIFLHGPPSTENSYFPGYSWTICYCKSCASILGWMFRRVKGGNVGLSEDRPKSFYGFMSSNIVLS